jgi:serine/threonine protein kinase
MENCGKDLSVLYKSGILSYPDFSQDDNSLPYRESLTIRDHIRQLLNILKCLHDNDYVHFDLKLDNIVMDNKGILKLIDAGSLTKIRGAGFPDVIVRGTRKFMAPELRKNPYVQNSAFLKATDIYSLGIILIIMIFPKEIGFDSVYKNNEYDDIFKLWKNNILLQKKNTPTTEIKIEDNDKAMDTGYTSIIYRNVTNFFGNIFSPWNKNTPTTEIKMEDIDKALDTEVKSMINKNFKKIFGNDIKFEDFFFLIPNNPRDISIYEISKRSTIQRLIDMFEEKTEADRIEYERLEADRIEYERLEAESLEAERLEDNIDEVDIDDVDIMEAEHISVKRNNPDAILESPSANTDDSRHKKRHRNQGGNKSKKPRRNHNNKSKRRQRKSCSK